MSFVFTELIPSVADHDSSLAGNVGLAPFVHPINQSSLLCNREDPLGYDAARCQDQSVRFTNGGPCLCSGNFRTWRSPVK